MYDDIGRGVVFTVRVLWWAVIGLLSVVIGGALVLLVGGCDGAAVIDGGAELDGAAVIVDGGAELDAAARAPIPIGPRDLGELGPCVGVNPMPFDACWLEALDAGWDPCPLHCVCSLELDGGIGCDGGAL